MFLVSRVDFIAPLPRPLIQILPTAEGAPRQEVILDEMEGTPSPVSIGLAFDDMTKLLFQDRNRHIVLLPCDLERFHLPSVLIRRFLESLDPVSVRRDHQHLVLLWGLAAAVVGLFH